MGRVALITGCSGQDGYYLAQLLRGKGYEVHGLDRRTPDFGGIRFVEADLLDEENLCGIVRAARPDEIYNLAAQSSVSKSFEAPVETGDVTALGAARLLEATRREHPQARFFQASSSEMFGLPARDPQDESTPLNPRSPYAAAKAYAHWMAKNYREAHGLFVCSGIMFNHESPRRPPFYLTRKITLAVKAIANGKQEGLSLGNLDVNRDWGYAPEYVDAMWRMLQQEKPDDYVIATGESHTVREFCTLAFECRGIALEWRGEGLEEQGVERGTGRVLVRVDPSLYRKTDVTLNRGDASKAERELGWKPKVTFRELVRIMVDAERDPKA